jgi:hypothetical protein
VPILELDGRAFLAGSASLSALAVLPGRAAAKSMLLAQGAAPPPAAPTPPGRLTFHGIDTYHGATIGTLKVDIAMLDAGNYRIVRTFNTAAGYSRVSTCSALRRGATPARKASFRAGGK